ncbi:MAG: hypothetical protein AB8B91_00930 [Rubripirellula sp.]
MFISLFAETRMAEVSLQYREEVATNTTSGLWYLLIPVAIVLVAIGIFKFINRPPAILNTPTGMLHELCRVHRINAAGRILMDRIAEEADLDQPATMALAPVQFEAAVKKAGKTIKYDRRQQSTLGMLRRRLFA